MDLHLTDLRAVSRKACYQDRMRAPALAVALVLPLALGGCLSSGPMGGECNRDNDCGGGEVCARDGMCALSSSVRSVVTRWTIGGSPPTDQLCASHPDLYIKFIGADFSDSFGYAPVPCALGQFTMDKLPDRYQAVELGVDNGTASTAPITSQNSAAINLVF